MDSATRIHGITLTGERENAPFARGETGEMFCPTNGPINGK